MHRSEVDNDRVFRSHASVAAAAAHGIIFMNDWAPRMQDCNIIECSYRGANMCTFYLQDWLKAVRARFRGTTA